MQGWDIRTILLYSAFPLRSSRLHTGVSTKLLKDEHLIGLGGGMLYWLVDEDYKHLMERR
jgi:hypothetical protein